MFHLVDVYYKYARQVDAYASDESSLTAIVFIRYSFRYRKTPHFLVQVLLSYLSNKWGAVHRLLDCFAKTISKSLILRFFHQGRSCHSRRPFRLICNKCTLRGPLVGIAINHLRYQSGQNLPGFVLIIFHVFFPPFKIYARLSKDTAIATPVVIPFDNSC